MATMMDGTWRSFKLFCFSGKIEQQDHSNYLQISVDEAGSIITRHSKNQKNPQIVAADHWHIEETRKRQFIYFGKKQVYEIITMEHAIMVLSDVVKGEKIFFAKMPLWNEYVEPAHNPVKYIQPRSEKKEG